MSDTMSTPSARRRATIVGQKLQSSKSPSAPSREGLIAETKNFLFDKKYANGVLFRAINEIFEEILSSMWRDD